MAKLPDLILQPTAKAIYEWYERKSASEPGRTYLGWSELGEPCTRALWYSLRWASDKRFDGRMLRLFESGHLEEDRVLQNLRAIGCEVFSRDPQTGGQFGCSSHGGHLKGHLDAVVKGLPEAPKTPHLVDVKTCNSKKFSELLKHGMQKTYPRYWGQAQGYMGEFGLTRGMYIFICKDTDQIHTERFEFDAEEHKRLQAKSTTVIFSPEPPERISNDPAWFGCKFCDHRSTCHATQAPKINCRTCAHATANQSGGWSCELQNIADLPIETQRAGCEEHRFIPGTLMHWAEPIDADAGANWIKYRIRDTGKEFTNGRYPQHLHSQEIYDCEDKEALTYMQDEDMQQLRATFDAKVVG